MDIGATRKMTPNRLSGFATTAADDPFRLDENGMPFHQNSADALAFVEQSKDHPFFLYYATWLVHTPIHTRSEPLLRKCTISAFESTDLARRLNVLGIDTIVVGGVVTNYAVMINAIAAADRGFRVTVLSDACASASQNKHDTALDILRPLCTVKTSVSLMAAATAT